MPSLPDFLFLTTMSGSIERTPQGTTINLGSSESSVEQDDVGLRKLAKIAQSRKRSYPATQPLEWGSEEVDDLDDDEVLEVPDLAEYFDQFEMQPEDIAKMCRAYATYLTSLLPQKKQKK